MLPHPAFTQADGLSALKRDTAPIEIRLAEACDAPALVRLAQLDSALAAASELPGLARGEEVLVAESDNEIVAALSLRDGLLVSDPFHRTNALISLLQTRRRQLATKRRGRIGGLLARHP